MTNRFAKMAAALLALACCASKAPPPDEGRGAEKVYWHGHPPLPHTLDALDLIHERAQAVCPLQLPWCAEVHWQFDPFTCSVGGQEVGGCQPYVGLCGVEVGWRPSLADTALVDEVGHYVWEFCFRGRTGEHQASDGHTEYDPDFAAFVRDTDAAIRSRWP